MKRTQMAALAALVVVVIAAAIAAAVMLGREDEPGTDAHVHIEPITTVDEVATAAMSGLHTWMPSQQQSPWDAMHAIADQFTGPLGEAASTRPDPDPTPREWGAWARSGDRVIGAVTLAPDQDPVAGDASQATRVVQIRQKVLHSDGVTTPLETITATVELERVGGEWKAANFQYQSIGQ